jgi:hypothetical protein
MIVIDASVVVNLAKKEGGLTEQFLYKSVIIRSKIRIYPWCYN